MKKYVLLLLFVGVVSLGYAQDKSELTWHTDFNDAKRIAEKENKPLMLFFTGSDWCGWCKRLQKEVFQQQDFVTWAKENVVLLELDFPRRKQLEKQQQLQNYFLQQKFGVRGFPTIWFASFKTTEGQDDIIQIDKALGSVGYVRGGVDAWLQSANQILAKK
ncbi:thioredoxin family protein [Neptunitalea lumnitzerae]|uniref:Thioredoxin domain-containing protein n=1 Tax=Neptunitalea lumnitzerae TaxID=2965509 RepID=A0ABQ5MH16_9FLAO|nr:thioredoxin family protein [Neptunitalea sp. Y10]GLB48688.1 hypothetical protein Y10_10560 [Neptunitalea sp. Y10]